MSTTALPLAPDAPLDRAESTRRSLKYRRGAGEILIVNYDGHGWWDPLSDRKGDIFGLVRHLDPGLSFGGACRLLCDFIGIAPAFPEVVRTRRTRGSRVPSPSVGTAAARCRAVHRPGSISPGSGVYRRASWSPRAQPTPFTKASAAAPGSPTVTARGF